MSEFVNDDLHTTVEEDVVQSHFVEDSPSGRFSRSDKELGHGSCKRVFSAVDHETGKEVAWNSIKTQNMTQREKERVLEEIKLFEQFDNPHILKLIKVWRNKGNNEVVMITELMTCSLKEYLNSKNERPRLKVIKNWCKNILLGLDYLHSRSPPVIHRDLKCENIFISSSNAEIRIGDFGLSTILQKSMLNSVVGTPYFMAPEMYQEKYGALVDIYSFGLCVIEMCTQTTPYSECKNQASLFHKIQSGEKPEAFYMIMDDKIKNFIARCIVPAEKRPTAKELLTSKFLEVSAEDPSNNEPVKLVAVTQKTAVKNEILSINAKPISNSIVEISLVVKGSYGNKSLVNFEFNTHEEVPETVAEELIRFMNLGPEALPLIFNAIDCNNLFEVSFPMPKQQLTPSFHGKSEDQILKFNLKLGIQENGYLKKVSVEINFDLNKDTPEKVAESTVKELGLDENDYSEILKCIREKVSNNDGVLQHAYSCLDLLDMENERDCNLQQIGKNQARSTTESVTSEIKSPRSYSSKNSSFEMYVKAHIHLEDPFSGNLSPINSYIEIKNSPPKSDDEENQIHLPKTSIIKAPISRKNKINDIKDVKQLQEVINFIFGTKIKVDGVYNKKCEGKVKVLQEKNKLPVDGVVTQKVWDVIMSKIYTGNYYTSVINK